MARKPTTYAQRKARRERRRAFAQCAAPLFIGLLLVMSSGLITLFWRA